MNLLWNPNTSVENPKNSTLLYAVVIDVIVNEEHSEYDEDGFNVGTIRFKYLDYGGHGDSPVNAYYARPLEISIQEYPLVGEVVAIQKTQGIHFYSRRIDVNKTLQVNTLPNIIERMLPKKSSQDRRDINEQAKHGVLNQSDDDFVDESLSGKNFQPKSIIYPLKNFEGDVIFQNRFGASLRFGSSLSENSLNQKFNEVGNKTIIGPTNSKNNDPIIVMRVGQQDNPLKTTKTTYALTMEDINLDSSCFVMSKEQEIYFNFSSKFDTLDKLGNNIYYPAIQDEMEKTILVGNQVILNSGRLVFNSKENDIIYSSNRDALFSANRDIILDAVRNIYINPIETGLIHLGTDVDDTTIDNYVVKYNELENILENILNLISTLANQTQYQFPNVSVSTQANSIISNIDDIRSRVVKIRN